MIPTRSDAGFTLLESLAALVVLGFVLAVLAQGARFAREVLPRQAHASRVGDEVEPVETALRSMVSHAWPGGGNEVRFTGTARRLSFRTRLPGNLVGTEVPAADVTLAADSDHHLFLLWRPWYRVWIAPPPVPARVDLLDGVDHVEFAYWNPDSGWAANWNGTAIPKLLRIRLVPAAGTAWRWPDIIAATERQPWLN